MSGSASPTPEENRSLIRLILKIDAALFTLGGIFLLLKDKFTDFVLLDSQMDIYLGAGAMIAGISTYMITDKFYTHR